MGDLIHPDLADVTLAAALHALADPARLHIVKALHVDGELCCTAALPDELAPKSTRSHHFKILRAAGLIETKKSGRVYLSTLRREAFDARFPDLLMTVFKVS